MQFFFLQWVCLLWVFVCLLLADSFKSLGKALMMTLMMLERRGAALSICHSTLTNDSMNKIVSLHKTIIYFIFSRTVNCNLQIFLFS